jgi:hypothetical protein
MKKLQNQFLFSFIVLITLWNVLFRVALSYMLKNEIFNMVIVPPVIFFLLMFFTGKYFGLKQWKDLPTDVSFKYHLSSFCIFFIVSYGFYFSAFQIRTQINIRLYFNFLGLRLDFSFYSICKI